MKPDFTSSFFFSLIACALSSVEAFGLLKTNNALKILPSSPSLTQRSTLPPNKTAEQEEKRRKKKNKYANFSKTDNLQLDPFEELLGESEKKKKELERDLSKKRNRYATLEEEQDVEETTNEKRERNKRLFPDNRTIDPYDPTTYGYTEIGTILGAHGVHGLVKIAAVTEFAERLCKPGIRHLKAQNRRSPREIRLLEGRNRLKNEYLIRLEGISDRNEAMKLRGSVLYARQEERPDDMDEDEYLISELVGLDVRLVTGYGEEDVEDAFMDDPRGELDISSRTTDNDKKEGEMTTVTDDQSVGGKFVGTVRGVVLAEEMCSIQGLGQDLLEVILPRGRYGAPSWKDEMVLIPLVPSIVPTIDIERGVIYIDPPGGLLDLTYVKEDNVRIKGFLPAVSSFQENRYK